MELADDFLAFCLDSGFLGLALLLLTGAAVVLVLLGALAGIAQAGRAFARGWAQGAGD